MYLNKKGEPDYISLPGLSIIRCDGISGMLALLPTNAVRFLNSASEYALMRKVGGGYIFTHRLVLEHFAGMYQSAHRDLS